MRFIMIVVKFINISFVRIIKFIYKSKCYFYRFLVGWSMLIIILSYSQWIVSVMLERIFKIQLSKADFFYSSSFTVVVLLPEFLIQMLLVLWYIVGCEYNLRDKYKNIFRVCALLFLLYWSYLSTFDNSKMIIGYLMEKHPYRTPFRIIFHSVHIILFMVILHLWEKFWDEK